MATSASRSIWRSSRRRWLGDSARRGMVSPLHPPSGDRKQVLRKDAPSYVALESRLAFVSGPRHPKGVLQVAEGGFNTRSPAQRPPEPALLLPLGARRRQTPSRRQGYLLHPLRLRFPLVRRRKEPSVPGGQPRRLPEQSFVLLEGGNPSLGIRPVALLHLKAAHHTMLHFIDPHQPPQLGRLVGFPFADDLGVFFEPTQHFVRRLRVPLPQPLPRLGDHLFHPGEEVSQLTDLNFRLHDIAPHLHPSRFPILERRARLSHHAPGHPQQLAITVPQPLR